MQFSRFDDFYIFYRTRANIELRRRSEKINVAKIAGKYTRVVAAAIAGRILRFDLQNSSLELVIGNIKERIATSYRGSAWYKKTSIC